MSINRRDDEIVILCPRSGDRYRRQGVSDGGAAFGGHGGAVPPTRRALPRREDMTTAPSQWVLSYIENQWAEERKRVRARFRA